MVSEGQPLDIAECVRRIWAGEGLSREEAAAFRAALDAKERAGHRLLGPLAGPDEPFDTVTGRCGLPVQDSRFATD